VTLGDEKRAATPAGKGSGLRHESELGAAAWPGTIAAAAAPAATDSWPSAIASAAGPAKGEGCGDADTVANCATPERSTPHTDGVAIVSVRLHPSGSLSPFCSSKEFGVLAAAPDKHSNKIVAPCGAPVDTQASPSAKAWPAYAVEPAATQPAYEP
jgi:hypothetical protein